jgi:hypothetical protein
MIVSTITKRVQEIQEDMKAEATRSHKSEK